MKKLGKYSIGMGDRFGHQGNAQLKAVLKAAENGIEITPVWNKSNREHSIIGTEPADVRKEADEAAKNAGFSKPYFVDADHINIDTVEKFIDHSDFFTIDVASYIGKQAEPREIDDFLKSVEKYTGILDIPGKDLTFNTTRKQLGKIAEKYLYAAIKAAEIYQKIAGRKGEGNFVTEVSMDEVPDPQTPVEMFFILKMLGARNIPLQTIAPKFSGRFNKGVDYVGDPEQFAGEFEADLLILDFAAKEFNLPENLKISVHSGSDKFAIYPHIGSIIRKHDKGIHLKTAGTTWLEEVIGLAESGGEALDFVKEMYIDSLSHIEELCAPYADVIDINRSLLPSADEVSRWDGSKFAASLRHDQSDGSFNPNMRQLIHVGYKLAAVKIDQYNRLLEENEEMVSKCVFENMYDRHISRVFKV
jgi:tagaturonate epimerase